MPSATSHDSASVAWTWAGAPSATPTAASRDSGAAACTFHIEPDHRVVYAYEVIVDELPAGHH